MTTKSRPESISALSRKARTAAQHGRVLALIDERLDAARRKVADLDHRRESIVLDGGDLAGHSREMVEAKELIATLQAAREGTLRKIDEASQAEARNVLEREIAAAHDEHIPALNDAWQRLYGLLDEVLTVATDIERHENAVENANWKARHNDRPDLVRHVRAVRDEVSRRHAPPLSEHLQGEPIRGKDESEEGFALRKANISAARTDAAHRNEPFKVAGERAVAAIQKIAIDHPDRRTALRMQAARRVDPARSLVAYEPGR